MTIDRRGCGAPEVRHRHVAAVALGLLAAGCGTPAPAATPPAAVASPGPSSGYVVVARDTWLRSAPAVDAPAARASDSHEARCNVEGASEPWVLRRVAVDGDWYVVENLQPAEAAAHCYANVDALAGWRLRFYVGQADALPVTRHRVEVEHEDGTGFTLSAGVVARPDGELARVEVDGNVVSLAVPPAAIGDDYGAPTEPLWVDDGDDDDGEDDALPAGALYVGGRRIDVDADEIEHDDERAVLTSACSQYRAKVHASERVGLSGRSGCMSGGGIDRTKYPRLPAGTQLTWPDGRGAGEVLEDQQLYWPDDPDGDRQCFRLPLIPRQQWDNHEQPRDEWFLRLCARLRDVR